MSADRPARAASCLCLSCRLVDAIQAHYGGEYGDAIEIVAAIMEILSMIHANLSPADRSEVTRHMLAGIAAAQRGTGPERPH